MLSQVAGILFLISSVQFSSLAQSCPTLCDPMNRSTPGLPVHNHHLEFTQTHVHRVHDTIQPSHPQSFPSPAAPNPSSIRLFSNESTLRMRWPKYWSFSFSIIPSKEIPGLISFRMDTTKTVVCGLRHPREALVEEFARFIRLGLCLEIALNQGTYM